MIVDSYAHVSLVKYQPVEQLIERMALVGVEHAVLVQPLGDYNNSYLRTILKRFPGQFRGVGIIRGKPHGAQQRLRQLIQTDGFAGVKGYV